MTAKAEATLTRLVELWRETRDPELSRIIAKFGEASESADAKLLRAKTKISAREWLAAIADASLVDRGAVLVSLAAATSGQVADRIRVLGSLDADPRIVDALHVLIETVPWTSSGARKVWTRTFELLIATADPRTIAVARAFNPAEMSTYSETAGQWMQERLTKVADKIAEHPGPTTLDADARAWVDEVARNLAAGERGPGVAAQLFTASLRDPDDLDARLVLADALMELGDPRGELIRVQIARESAPEDRKLATREKQILTEHRDALLGALAPIVRKGTLEFARGFVRACEFDPMVHANVLAAALADEQLATVRRIRAPLEVVLAPQLRSVRDVSVIHVRGQSLAPLFRSDRPLSFESVECFIEAHDVALLDGCECLGSVRRLGIGGRPDEQARALTRALARKVTQLHLCNPNLARLGSLLARALARNAAPGTVSCDLQPDWETWSGLLSLDRAANGSIVARLDLAPPPTSSQGSMTRVLEGITASVAAIQPLGVARLEVRASKTIRDAGVRARLLAAVNAANTTIAEVVPRLDESAG